MAWAQTSVGYQLCPVPCGIMDSVLMPCSQHLQFSQISLIDKRMAYCSRIDLNAFSSSRFLLRSFLGLNLINATWKMWPNCELYPPVPKSLRVGTNDKRYLGPFLYQVCCSVDFGLPLKYSKISNVVKYRLWWGEFSTYCFIHHLSIIKVGLAGD